MTADNDLAANYRRGNFNGRLGSGDRPCLMLVDFSMAYLDPASPLWAGEGAERAVEAAQQLLESARRSGCPVVHTRIELRTPSDGGLFRKKVPALEVFVSGSPLAAAPAGLEPRSDEEVITKQYASAFFGTPLASTLHVRGIDSIVMGGLSTSGCVRASALDAMQYGFAPLVVREACGDRHEGPHDAALFDLAAKYADVVGLDEALQVVGQTNA